MIRKIILVLLMMVPALSFADAPVMKYRVYFKTNEKYTGASDACQVLKTSSFTPSLDGLLDAKGYYLRCQNLRFDGYVDYVSLDKKLLCPNDEEPNLSLPLNQQCPSSCPKDNEVKISQKFPTRDLMVNTPYPTCYNSCSVEVKTLDDCWKYINTPGTYGHCDFTARNTGNQCATADSEGLIPAPTADKAEKTTSGVQKAPNAISCPKGTSQAGMSADGVPLCVGTGTNQNNQKTSETTTKPETVTNNPDGSSTKTQVTEIKNPDGSTTTQTKTTTTSADGTVSVKMSTNTSATPGGEPGKPGANGADGKDAKGLCETNPELTICKNSNISGDCASGLSFTGDAIQGSIAQTSKAMHCKQQKDEAELKASGLYAKGNAAANGSDPDAAGLPSPGKADKVSVPSSLDVSGWSGGGSPFSDFSFTLRGRSFTVPVRKWVSYLEPFKYVLMILASLFSFRLLSGAILKD